MRLIKINDFIELYRLFGQEKTWTNKKRKHKEELWQYLSKHISHEIICKAGIYSLNYVNEFTVIRVPPKKTGYLMPYRGKLVLILATYRFGHDFYITCFPLKEKSISQNQIDNMTAIGNLFVPQSNPSDLLHAYTK